MAAPHTATVVWTRGTDDFLDQRYHRILRGVDAHGSAVDTADAAEQLVEVIRELHSKGKELRELRASNNSPKR